MKRYDKYKPSGIDWIGDIPEHWSIATVGRVTNLGRGRVISNLEIGENPGDYPVYSSQTENNGVMGNLATYDFDGEYVTWTTDGANAGTVFHRSGKFNCTNVCGTIQPKNWEQLDLRFLPYYLNLGTKYSVRLDINPKLMNNMMAKIPLIIPTKDEQNIIANYLQHKTKEIESIIKSKNSILTLLREERISTINEAVSGINKNWKQIKLKYLTKIISKGTTPSTVGAEILANGEVRFLKAENILQSNYLSEFPANYIDLKTNEILKRSELVENDVLIVIAGATIGKVAILEKSFVPANTNQAVCFIRLIDKNLAPWIWLYLQSNIVKEYISIDAVQSAQPNLSMEKLGNFIINMPDDKERESIIENLRQELNRIDDTMQKIEREIELISEYKTSLYFEIVTGKIKVT